TAFALTDSSRNRSPIVLPAATMRSSPFTTGTTPSRLTARSCSLSIIVRKIVGGGDFRRRRSPDSADRRDPIRTGVTERSDELRPNSADRDARKRGAANDVRQQRDATARHPRVRARREDVSG